MKKVFKISGLVLVGTLLLLALVLFYFNQSGIPEYAWEPPAEILSLKTSRDSATVARGALIGALHCVKCHGGPEGRLTGKSMDDLPPMFGKIYTLNITRDSLHGIGAWTDGELYYYLRTGIRKNGSWSPPFMPKYSLMADEDLKAVIAWLRSDDPRLAPDTREFPPNKFNLMVKTLAHTIAVPPPLPARPVLIPDTSDRAAYGKYVANGLNNCFQCHSGDLLKINAQEPEKSFGYYGGGTALRNAAGENILSANLTMDMETGIGAWTEQQFADAVRFGKHPHGGTLRQPMSPYPMLSEQEVKAIFHYLQTIPTIKNPALRAEAVSN